VDWLSGQARQEDRKLTNLVNITIDIKYQGAVFNDYIYIKAVTSRKPELKKNIKFYYRSSYSHIHDHVCHIP
jgi:hypothetical protein